MHTQLHVYLVRIWFLLNAFAALYPPIYWAVGNSTVMVIGLPISLLYFMGISLSLTLNILYAYWQERTHGELA